MESEKIAVEITELKASMRALAKDMKLMNKDMVRLHESFVSLQKELNPYLDGAKSARTLAQATSWIAGFIVVLTAAYWAVLKLTIGK